MQEVEVPEHTTRRAPHMEKYVQIKPVVCEDEPDAHRISLKVGVQEFAIGAYPADTKDDAEWMRDMLCVALDNLVKTEMASRTEDAIGTAQRE